MPYSSWLNSAKVFTTRHTSRLIPQIVADAKLIKSRLQITLALTTIPCVGGFAYFYRKNDYFLPATLKDIQLHYWQLKFALLHKTPEIKRLQHSSTFHTILSPDLTYWLTQYFLITDSKENESITRKNVTDLLIEAGLASDKLETSGYLRTFLHGRGKESRASDSCHINEVFGLIENIYFEMNNHTDDSLAQSQESFKAFEKLLIKAAQSKVDPKQLDPQVQINSQTHAKEVDPTTNEDHLLNLLAQHQKSKQNYLNIQKRSKLTEAQKAKLDNIVKQEALLRRELDRAVSKKTIEKMKAAKSK